MQSLKLSETGDILMSTSGNLLMVEGTEEISQCCHIGIGTNKAEWFLNPDMGITFSKFLGKQINEEEMREELTQGLMQEERIQSVDLINFTVEKNSRTLLVTFDATSTEGERIQAKEVSIGAG
ncbi:DUF2634 domain-containing protein [Paenibacillus macquariensis]|uniref:DUF2634 domain-containing protein n=1 Tax=Paenibacillus macquariensis TaxID=948756 RepID=A0ABY1JSD4_9BACL|nr:DUF2634 domain-containing protein [Paenibacillus macquariensis]MEC0092920.1 DUF2634 domain-containing protein [Paenibacillus macquariensis]OAB36287.1 hypothetical protein PMSM_07520 [Paenibacillus macquariensis subsp. macquariensis]SIQ68763.1 Protein of unknown function [Paenibacillus macquariensis]